MGKIEVRPSMDIHVVSDMHIEFGDAPDISEWGGEVLLMCGDIVQLNRLNERRIVYLMNLFKKYEQVFWVFGNHEWYGSVIKPGVHQEIEKLFHDRGHRHLRVLENEHVLYRGVRFIGATLWTSFKGLSAEATLQAKAYAEQRMADFSYIRKPDNSFWTPDDSVAAHTISRRYITMSIACSEPCVVLTHHLPTYRLIPEKFVGNSLNPAYANHLEYLMGDQLEIWACGHAHERREVMVKGTRCRVNACGYPTELESLGIYRPAEMTLVL